MPASGLEQYVDLVNKEMVNLYGVTFEDLGVGSLDDPWFGNGIKGAYESKETPKEFALWYGEKYDLIPRSEFE